MGGAHFDWLFDVGLTKLLQLQSNIILYVVGSISCIYYGFVTFLKDNIIVSV